MSGYTIAPIDALQTGTAASTRTITTGGATSTHEIQAASKTESIATFVLTKTNEAEHGNKVAAVGAGVGVGIGVPLPAALGAVLFLHLREKHISRALRGQLAGGIDEQQYAEPKQPHSQFKPFQELPTGPGHQQLQGERQNFNAEFDLTFVARYTKTSAY